MSEQITHNDIKELFVEEEVYPGFEMVCNSCGQPLDRLDGEAWLDNVGACFTCEKLFVESYMFSQETSSKSEIKTQVYKLKEEK